MKERLLTAIPMIIVLVLTFALPGVFGAVLFGLLSIGIMMTACTEAFDMMQIDGRGRQQLCLCIYSALMIVCAAFCKFQFGVALTAIYIIAAFLLIFNEEPKRNNVSAVIMSLGISLYICWNLMFMVRMYFLYGVTETAGRLLLLYMIICTKMADIGAYLAGTYTAKLPGGNHKLAPHLSPKKSWEGLIGGMVFAVAAALLLLMVPGMTSIFGRKIFGIFSAVCFGVLAAIIGLVGDLAESTLKRAANMKDSGKIPGLGGMLDVLDSLVFVAPLFYAYVMSVL